MVHITVGARRHSSVVSAIKIVSQTLVKKRGPLTQTRAGPLKTLLIGTYMITNPRIEQNYLGQIVARV